MSALLFSDLLGTLHLSYHVVLINSSSRLPDVSTNGILDSVLTTSVFPSVELHGIFERTSRDVVIGGTRTVVGNRGMRFGAPSASYFFVGHKSGCAALRAIMNLVARELPSTCGIGPLASVRILYPSEGVSANALGLGGILRRGLGPRDESGRRVTCGNVCFHRNSGIVRVGGGCSVVFGGTGNRANDNIFGNSINCVDRVSVHNNVLGIEFRSGAIACFSRSLSRLRLTCTMAIRGDRNDRCSCMVVPLYRIPSQLICQGLLCATIAHTGGVLVLMNSRTV